MITGLDTHQVLDLGMIVKILNSQLSRKNTGHSVGEMRSCAQHFHFQVSGKSKGFQGGDQSSKGRGYLSPDTEPFKFKQPICNYAI